MVVGIVTMILSQKKKTSLPKISYYDYQNRTGSLTNMITGGYLSAKIRTSYYTKDQNSLYQLPTQGGQCSLGTACSDVFSGLVNLIGSVELRSAEDWVMIEFFDLDENSTYTVTATSNAETNQNSSTIVTLIGAESFVAASSLASSTEQTTISFPASNNKMNGYVIQWKEIDPGKDGAFGLQSRWDISTGGTLGYAITAIRLHKEVKINNNNNNNNEEDIITPIKTGDKTKKQYRWQYYNCNSCYNIAGLYSVGWNTMLFLQKSTAR